MIERPARAAVQTLRDRAKLSVRGIALASEPVLAGERVHLAEDRLLLHRIEPEDHSTGAGALEGAHLVRRQPLPGEAEHGEVEARRVATGLARPRADVLDARRELLDARHDRHPAVAPLDDTLRRARIHDRAVQDRRMGLLRRLRVD